MRAKVPKGIKNDIPLFVLSNTQWIICIVSFTGLLVSISIGLYEIVPLFPIAGGYLMFRKIKGESPWIVWWRRFLFRLRPKKVIRRERRGYIGLQKEN